MSRARLWLGAPPSRRRRRPSKLPLLLVLGAGLVVGACLAEPRATRATPGPRTPSSAPNRPADPWTGDGRVPLRITAAEGALTVRVSTDGGEQVDLRRQGTEVVASDGRRGPWLVLELPRGGRLWRYRDRAYAGDLLVVPAGAGGLELSALLDLEEYVEGVVAAELILWSAPPSLLEAQAIAARSYAVANLDQRGRSGGAFLVDSVLDQAFRGRFEPDAAARSRGIDTRLAAAIERTRGQVLTVAGEVLDARFHAACGGTTARASDVFASSPPPAHEPATCDPCQASRRAILAAQAQAAEPPGDHADLAWSYTAGPAELAALARAADVGNRLQSYSVRREDPSGRWLEWALVGPEGREQVPFALVRESLGWDHVRSAAVRSTWPPQGSTIRSGLRFDGFGHGHGAGLCQRGADRHARAGRDADWILLHYYRGARIEQLEDLNR
ncbi:MAG: SpoIID/LytB domain-containing protein [Planctomycetota bacterium]